MDELSCFKEAPIRMRECEKELLATADVVFTGGQSLFRSKKNQHPNIYLFPSSIDVPHFARARAVLSEPADQASISHIRIGYAGVIDERMDLDLVAAVADARPEWQMILLGPVVKISNHALPVRPNIHYLGMKPYEQLPDYLGGWDVAMLPFARNESTRFISPTKTPEYLAAGRPVVSTSIRDVVDGYGELGVVHVADEPQDFIRAVDRALREDVSARLEKVDLLLSKSSWSRTWGRMSELIEDAIRKRVQDVRPPHPATFPRGPRPSAALS
jgi:UDP-galactopyranose mutase